MNNTILDIQLLPILAALGFLSVIVLWTIIKFHKNTLVIAILIPLTIAAFTTTYITLENVLGYPITQEMKDDTLYIEHLVSENNNVIYVWILEPGGTVPRSIIIPLTKENKKELKKAKQQQGQGIPQLIKQKGAKGPLGVGETDGGEYETYNFQPTDPNGLKDKQEENNQTF